MDISSNKIHELTPLLSVLGICFLVIACSSPNRGLFAGKTAHERYADKISDAGLKETAIGQSWFAASAKSLSQPLTIRLPYRETGYFEATQPDAAGYRFAAKRGDKIFIRLDKKPLAGFSLFLDLWQPDNAAQPRLLAAADTNSAILTYEINKDGDYLLRMQPELLAGGEYTLEVRTGPSLDFPIAATARPRISSFWGDARDAGARSHEGVDIFSAFRTPLLAAAQGQVTSVTENRLGGKVIFLRPKGKDFVLYYAHLDSQLVQQGQHVQVGDTIGLMGNTGNARNTAFHLHFGIYAAGGAIDPLPFIDTKRAEPAAIQVPVTDLKTLRRSVRNATIHIAPDRQAARLLAPPAGTLLQLRSATGAWYKVKLPDGTEGFMAGNAVNPLATPLRTYKPDSTQMLQDKPSPLSATKALIARDNTIQVVGLFDNYYYVRAGNKQGWIRMANN
jgi:peptidoglycan LD-endopeptidase LytH